ncbi:hypothetical protein VP01_7326g2 [Puccinia sorghi]|uniref:Uncharacterized protein n=1 Tax=Puccinia sorghi TaxID=27349 RepID=A0A0L6UF25_9BASI|nr:hypothetical protein VP01_7326g2 [Puccinia sorghi]
MNIFWIQLAEQQVENFYEFWGLLIYAKLFEDERLCSLDELLDDPLDEDKMCHTPPWQSQLEAVLVNCVDDAYKELRRNEYPGQTGRKPSKRISQINL